MKKKVIIASVLASAMLAGCVTQPTGPDIAVMPGKGKAWADFQQDDATCRGFASDRVAGKAESANDHAILSTIIGAGLGAALGGAVGGGNGAGVGAAAGGVVGSSYGANQSGRAQGSLQRQYDIAYTQCMSAKGNDVPQAGYGPRRDRGYYGPPPGEYGPPPGEYGPPPPDNNGPPPPPPGN
jgi:predicted small secreted protein